MIKDRLIEAMQRKGINSQDLYKKSGVLKAHIMEYMLGESMPNDKTILRMANALGVNDAWLAGKEVSISDENPKERNVTVAKAAELLGKTQMFVRIGLQRERLPFGTAVKMSTKWSYHISPSLLEKYLNQEVEKSTVE